MPPEVQPCEIINKAKLKNAFIAVGRNLIMRDAVTSLIRKYDVTGRYLDRDAIAGRDGLAALALQHAFVFHADDTRGAVLATVAAAGWMVDTVEHAGYGEGRTVCVTDFHNLASAAAVLASSA